MNRTTAFALAFALAALMTAVRSVPAFGEFLSLNGKNLALFLDDRTGRFFVENPNPKSRSLKELLFKDNPPTSSINVILDGKPYKLSELKTVKPFAVDDNVLRGLFQLRKTSVKIEFVLTNLRGRDESLLLCMVSFQNLEEPQLMAGARFLLDTVIGESARKPALYLSSGEKLDYDRLLAAAAVPEFILSGHYEMDSPTFGTGLYIYPSVNELKPASVIVGNWKKLDEKELGYPVDPLARFRYNEFGNPDAAVAVFYRDIFVKRGEELTFGLILTTARLERGGLKMTEAVVSPLLAGVPLVVTNFVTNTVGTESGPTNITMTITSNANADALRWSGQLELLERAALLVEKLESMLGVTNASGAAPAATPAGSGLERGLGNAIPRNTAVNPFERQTGDPAPAARPDAPRNPRPEQQAAVIPDATPTVIRTNLVITNTELSDIQIRELQTERDKIQKQYEEKIQSLEVYYRNLLKKQ